MQNGMEEDNLFKDLQLNNFANGANPFRKGSRPMF
ncbi:Uncharacterized protein BM_BM1496 [Brugia malayi]|uniref:Bm1496 n=1 Tax=Brugia malayi TaxID=6279 RepID=A0A0J9Y2E8_BRUMA|nr:Uncharacterized protein BM_BM1496 [Brugia malayi]CDQ00449.1 Bm1496 [Brugia malayi]VIO86258.1 Uncharacterized protein BM_BM1496 [Brugia malayi]